MRLNRDKRYDPEKAEKRATKLSKKSRVHLKFNDEVWAEIDAMLVEDFSPEQIAGREKLEGWATLCVPSIYRHVKGKSELEKHLRHNNRMSGFCILEPLRTKDADDLAVTIIAAFEPYKEYLHMVTSDNGKEFAGHPRMAEELKFDYFFAHPYHSWERGPTRT